MPHGGGLISATLPAIGPHQARTFVFQEALWGVHDGSTLSQHVGVALRAQGLLTETEALMPLERVEAHGSAGPQGGALQDARVQIEVPAGAVTTTVDLHYRPRFVYEDQPARGRTACRA